MKKITLLLTIMAVVLAFGSAYAMEMSEGRTNGVTVFHPDRAARRRLELVGHYQVDPRVRRPRRGKRCGSPPANDTVSGIFELHLDKSLVCLPYLIVCRG